MAMETVSVATLKNNLSRYLAVAKNGREFIITSHRHPVARLSPVEKTAVDLRIIPTKKPVSTLSKIKGLNLEVDHLADLLADRRRR
jgi:prevent-host-death family protein